MPQATDEQRALMEKWFGDPISDEGPWKFLMARGWGDVAGLITPPVSFHHPSIYELACIDFLCCEWDYGFMGLPTL